MKTDKRELILNSAEELMTSGNGAGLSMNMIAQNAGIAKGGIYYYFSSKEEVLYAVIQRAYRTAVHEYLDRDDVNESGLDKLKSLFRVIISRKFRNEQSNLLSALHVNENALIHNYLKLIAVEEISPLLERILLQCQEENTIKLQATPMEVSEMIVSVLTFFLDGTIFDPEKTAGKLKLFSRVLDICLDAGTGTFSFISEAAAEDRQ